MATLARVLAEEFNFSNAFDPSLTRFCRGENMIEMKFLEGDGEVKQHLLACGQQLTGRPDTLSYPEAVTLAPDRSRDIG